MKSKLLTGGALALLLATVSAQDYTFSTLAGLAGHGGAVDGTGSSARFSHPFGVAVDRSGNVFVADTDNHTIRQISATGAVSTLAGAAGQPGSVDGPGASARFNRPRAVTVDDAGNVFVADTGNHTIRKITPTGGVSTLAGSAGQVGKTDGLGGAARFTNPISLAVDRAGVMYVIDPSGNWDGNDRVRMIAPSGDVTTLTGPGLIAPTAIAVDDSGAIFVADFVEGYSEITRIRRVTATGTTPFVPELSNYISYGLGLAVDGAGNVFVAEDGTGRIRKITPLGDITTIGGNLMSLADGTDGPGGVATFSSPEGLAVDRAGNVYVCDTDNHTIRKGTPSSATAPAAPTTLAVVAVGHEISFSATGATGGVQWQVSTDSRANWTNLTNDATYSGATTGTLTLAGATAALDDHFYRAVAAGTGSPIGPDLQLEVRDALFPHPTGVTMFRGDVCISDSVTNAVQRFDFYGSDVFLLAGSRGQAGSTDGVGNNARFSQPGGLAVAADGTLTLADTANGTIRRIAPGGTVTTLAGSPGNRGNVDATGAAASFSSARDVAQDSGGTTYVADSLNHTVRKVSPGGAATTLAGLAGVAGTSDGAGAAARFNNPSGITVDSSGNVYVADTTNNTIRKISAGGSVTTLAGLAGVAGSSDGTGSDALFNRPMGLRVDDAGNLYLTDTGNSTIRRISPAGAVTTVAGLPTVAGNLGGAGPAARFNQPEALYVSPNGQWLVVADTGNAAIRAQYQGGTFFTLEYNNAGTVTTTTSSGSGASSGSTAGAGSGGTQTTGGAGTSSNNAAGGSSGGGSLDGCLVTLLSLLRLLRRRGPAPKPARI